MTQQEGVELAIRSYVLSGDFPALGFLIRLAAAQLDEETLGHSLKSSNAESDQLRAAEGAGETDEQERPVARIRCEPNATCLSAYP